MEQTDGSYRQLFTFRLDLFQILAVEVVYADTKGVLLDGLPQFKIISLSLINRRTIHLDGTTMELLCKKSWKINRECWIGFPEHLIELILGSKTPIQDIHQDLDKKSRDYDDDQVAKDDDA